MDRACGDGPQQESRRLGCRGTPGRARPRGGGDFSGDGAGLGPRSAQGFGPSAVVSDSGIGTTRRLRRHPQVACSPGQCGMRIMDEEATVVHG